MQVRVFDGVNFMEFCRLLTPFSSKASHSTKILSIFRLFDVDGDGPIAHSCAQSISIHLL